MHRPDILFLDEPTTGLDPRSRNDLWDVLRELVRDGTTIIHAPVADQAALHELLDGALVPMSPIGPPHSSAVQRLMELLLPALLGRATVRAQSPFAAHELSEPEPDIAVVLRDDYGSAHPDQAC